MPRNYILLEPILTHYQIDISLINSLEEIGRLELKIENNQYFIPEKQLSTLEKMIRLNSDLNINMEGIDMIFNLLDKIEKIEKKNQKLKRKLDELGFILEDLS